MARPRAFNTDAALDGAMNVFWEKGYEEASLPDLLSGMKLTRGSLYKAFKDKKSLFLTILERYDHHAVDKAIVELTNPDIPDGWDRIMALFISLSDNVQSGEQRGCLLCSAAAGPAAYDPEIASAVHHSLSRMRKGFADALGPQSDLADLLLTQYVGLRILSRSSAHADTIAASIAGLAQLRP